MMLTSQITQEERLILRLNARDSTSFIINGLNTLPELCLQKIFDHLPLKDLNQIMLQSNNLKHLREQVVDYFTSKFKGRNVDIKMVNNKVQYQPNDAQKLLAYNTKITIFCSNQTVFNQVRRLRLQPQTIIFKNLSPTRPIPTHSSEQLRKYMSKCMKHVECAEFCFHEHDGRFVDAALRNANKIRELVLISLKQCNRDGYRDKWPYQSYPMLKCIQFDDGCQERKDEFLHLLSNNPGIKNLKFSRNISDALNFIGEQDLHLNQLHLKVNKSESIPSLCSTLNDLYDGAHYENLFLVLNGNCNLTTVMVSLPLCKGLVGIKFEREIFWGHTQQQLIANFENLKVLQLKGGSIQSIRELIRLCRTLEHIVIERVIQDHSMPHTIELNNDRRFLSGAKPLNIWVEEWAYLKLKTCAVTPMITIRRFESFVPSY